MSTTNTLTDYETNAADFDKFRQPNSNIIQLLNNAFYHNAGAILSIGCGTGRYETELSKHRTVVGLDRSPGMLRHAKTRLKHLVLGDMSRLPFANKTFAGAYFMQSLHHFGANLDISTEARDAARQGVLQEAIRVVHEGAIIIVQRDPSQNQAVWFWKYSPQALEVKMVIQPKVSILVEWFRQLGLTNVEARPIYDPMARGFYNEHSPLDPAFRRSFSDFSYLSDEDVAKGVERLRAAIENGTVVDDIEACKQRFREIGGTVFIVSGEKR